MKKMMLLLSLGLLLVQIGNVSVASAATPPRGIYLQVEERGEAWFIVLTRGERFYMKNGAAAYAALHSFGMGVSNVDLAKIPVGVLPLAGEVDTDGDAIADKMEDALGMNVNSQDSDNDGHPDWTELTYEYNPTGSGGLETKDHAFANSLKGHILLQVESRGQAWYVNPVDGKRYYMADGDAAYRVMHDLGVGITNADLAKIPTLTTPLECGTSVDCVLSAVEGDVPMKATITYWDYLGSTTYEYVVEVEHALPGTDGLYTDSGYYRSATVNGAANPYMIGASKTCTYSDRSAMVTQITNWINWMSSENDLDFATCVEEYPDVPEYQE